MKKIFFFIIATITFFASCSEGTDGIGGGLTDISDNVIISTDEFNIESTSVKGTDFGAINARSSFTYLGRMYDAETYSYINADLMTQVIPMTNQFLESYNMVRIFPGIDSLYLLDDKGEVLPNGKELTEEQRANKMKYLKADSCYLTFYISDFKGDSLAQMSVNVKELSQPYLESKDYSIFFDPEAEGMVRTENGSINVNRTYSIKNMVAEGLGTTRTHNHFVSIPLNSKYIGRDGVEYSNYGSYLMKQYIDKDAAYHKGYNSHTQFLKQLCPGFYLKHIGGEGAMSQITATTLTVYYRMVYPSSETADEIHKVQAVFSGTEESIQHSTIDDDGVDYLIDKSNAVGSNYTYAKSPDAIYTQITLDVDAVMKDHENDSLSTVRIFIPRLNNETSNKYNLDAPKNLLLLPVDSVQSFFEKKKIADSRTSYIAAYSSATNGYTFGNISSLVNTMYRHKQEGIASSNYNKMVIIPAEVTTSTATSSTTASVTKVSHSMALESTRLKKGTASNGAIKASVIYTRYKSK